MSSRTPRSEQKQDTHEKILESAGRLLRTSGISGASVAEVMKGAGLTVGGFYGHFTSKDALVGAALREAFAEMRGKIVETDDGLGDLERLEVALARYLSARHRDNPAQGCPLPATLGEVANQGGEIVRVVEEELEKQLQALAGAEHRELALASVALMVGGLSLARALRGTPLSDEVLESSIRFGRAALHGPSNEKVEDSE